MKNIFKWTIPIIIGIFNLSCDSKLGILDLDAFTITIQKPGELIQSININHKDELISYNLKKGCTGLSIFNLTSPDSSKYIISPKVVTFNKGEFYLILVNVLKANSMEQDTYAFEIGEDLWKPGSKIKAIKFRI